MIDLGTYFAMVVCPSVVALAILFAVVRGPRPGEIVSSHRDDPSEPGNPNKDVVDR